MKVLSIIEPFATLISDNKKLIETRSWKTNYRGELYIHASLTKPKRYPNIIDQSSYNHLNPGKIICKCKLVDCIYMTDEYIDYIRENDYQEYLCGEYEVGRYAWVLSDIEVLNKPIAIKGHLGLWNYEK